MKELLAFLACIAFSVGSSAAWLYAVVVDAQASRIGWVIADILIPPLGAIRGLILWL